MSGWDPMLELAAVAECARAAGLDVVALAVDQLAQHLAVNPGAVTRGARAGARCVRDDLLAGRLAPAEASAAIDVYERAAAVAQSELLARPPVPPVAELRAVAGGLAEEGLLGWSRVVACWAEVVLRDPSSVAETALTESIEAGLRAGASCGSCRFAHAKVQAALAWVATVAGDHALRLEVS